MQTVQRLTRWLQLSVLAAIAYLLTLVTVAIIPVAPFLKLDLSDLPLLIGMLAFGISGGLTVAVLKELLHLFLVGFSLPNLLGSCSSLIASLTILLTWWVLLRSVTHHNRWFWIFSMVMVTLALTLIMALTDLLLIPWYLKLMGMRLSLPLPKIILGAVVPFNLVKGVVISSLFKFVADRLKESHWFKDLTS